MSCAVEVLIYYTINKTLIYISKADASGVRLKSMKSKDYISGFLNFILSHFCRPGIESVITLFARSQDQYIFPGSVFNLNKQVLDDHKLLIWWMEVLNLLKLQSSVQARVFIPGLDAQQHRPYIATATNSTNSLPWKYGLPFGEEAPKMKALDIIPKFPDDPKSRFLENLILENNNISCNKFWKLLGFRQECGGGRMVGFLVV